MKLYFLLIMLFFIPFFCHSQWNQTGSFSTYMYSVHFIDSDNGYIVGNTGLIMKSIDGGISWTPKSSGTTDMLRSVDFVNDTIGYVVGYKGNVSSTILKTNNGGETWEHQFFGATDESFNDVCFINPDTGYVVGGSLQKTINGGEEWIEYASVSGFSICFNSDSVGFLVGSEIFKTTDSGETWVSKFSSPICTFFSVNFLDSLIGYASGYIISGPWEKSGLLMKTIDSGETWNSINTGTTFDINCVYPLQTNVCYLVNSGGEIMSTYNGGSNWNIEHTAAPYGLNSIFLLDNSIGWVVGNNGVILYTTNLGNEIMEDKSKVFLSPNPASRIISINNIDYLNKIEFYNINGIKCMEINENINKVDISNLRNGIYLLRIYLKDKVILEKLIINKC